MATTKEHVAEMRLLGDNELVATGQLDNSARLGVVRRDIARLSTFLREREILAAETNGEGE
jgi:ribosomal protein L29